MSRSKEKHREYMRLRRLRERGISNLSINSKGAMGPYSGKQVSQGAKGEQHNVTLKNSYRSPNTDFVIRLLNNSNKARKILENMGFIPF